VATDYLRQQRPICSRRVDGFQATVPARRRRDRAQGFATTPLSSPWRWTSR